MDRRGPEGCAEQAAAEKQPTLRRGLLSGSSPVRPKSGRAVLLRENRPRRSLVEFSTGRRRSVGVSRSILDGVSGQQVADDPQFRTVASATREHNLPSVRRRAGTHPVGELSDFLFLARLRELVLRANPVLTDLLAIVFHYSCPIPLFHGASAGSGRKFSMAQISCVRSPAVKATRVPSSG